MSDRETELVARALYVDDGHNPNMWDEEREEEKELWRRAATTAIKVHKQTAQEDLRDRLAMAAMTGLMAAMYSDYNPDDRDCTIWSRQGIEFVADISYDHADAMLKARLPLEDTDQ